MIRIDSGTRVPILSWCGHPEAGAIKQAQDLANHPAVFQHVALMPDTHQGMGMPIGGAVALDKAISPNMVGVDIGCGMAAYNTGFAVDQVKPHLKQIVEIILKLVPMGFKHRDPNRVVEEYEDIATDLHDAIKTRYDPSVRLPWLDDDSYNVMLSQVGTLGGGNHFQEVQQDENGQVWVMLHSGSRNLGKRTCDYFNKLALQMNKRWWTPLPNDDLAFFPADTDEGRQYIDAMNMALDFAKINRKFMMQLIGQAFEHCGLQWKDGWTKMYHDVHHNYASLEHHMGRDLWVHRKGATLARKGTVGIIPGSMGTNSYIVSGKGNPASFNSCSHGAGRAMSRKQAKQQITVDAFKQAMIGIEFSAFNESLDEAPQAYKDINVVMAEQADLVEITTKLSPLAVIKDTSVKGDD